MYYCFVFIHTPNWNQCQMCCDNVSRLFRIVFAHKSRWNMLPVSFTAELVKRQHSPAKCYIQPYFIYILYAHLAESHRKCTFPKMCANIRTDYQCAVMTHSWTHNYLIISNLITFIYHFAISTLQFALK